MLVSPHQYPNLQNCNTSRNTFNSPCFKHWHSASLTGYNMYLILCLVTTKQRPTQPPASPMPFQSSMTPHWGPWLTRYPFLGPRLVSRRASPLTSFWVCTVSWFPSLLLLPWHETSISVSSRSYSCLWGILLSVALQGWINSWQLARNARQAAGHLL